MAYFVYLLLPLRKLASEGGEKKGDKGRGEEKRWIRKFVIKGNQGKKRNAWIKIQKEIETKDIEIQGGGGGRRGSRRGDEKQKKEETYQRRRISSLRKRKRKRRIFSIMKDWKRRN